MGSEAFLNLLSIQGEIEIQIKLCYFIHKMSIIEEENIKQIPLKS